MYAIRKTGYPLTTLDKYFLKNFESLTTGTINESVKGKAFIQPIKKNGKWFTVSPYPLQLGKFVKDISILGYFEDQIIKEPWINYFSIKAVKRIKYSGDPIPTYFIHIKELEIENLEEKIFTIIPVKHISGDGLWINNINYRYIKGLLLKEIEGYSIKGIYSELSEELIDGLEIEGKEDLLPLIAISSPGITETRAGGFHSIILGKKVDHAKCIRRRLITITNDPLLTKGLSLWDYRDSTINDYEKKFINRPTYRPEYTVLIRGSQKQRVWADEWLPNLNYDYPILLTNTPKLKDDKRNPLFTNRDIYDYITFMRFVKPLIPENSDELLAEYSKFIISYAQKIAAPREMIGSKKFLDPSSYGKPETILRLSAAISRIHYRNIRIPDLELAKELLLSIIEQSIGLIHLDKSSTTDRGLSTTKMENFLYLKLCELIESYPAGISREILSKHIALSRNQKDIDNIISKLINSGLIYTIKRNRTTYYFPIQ